MFNRPKVYLRGLAYEAEIDRQDGRAHASQDFLTLPGQVLAEAYLAVTDEVPEGEDPFIDGYRERYYELVGRFTQNE